jgi:3-oxoacyl-[acyl-carrier protein] reductase
MEKQMLAGILSRTSVPPRNGTRPFCGASYTATKGAINTLTKNVAMRLCDTNIRCNAIAPGATVTPAHLVN